MHANSYRLAAVAVLALFANPTVAQGPFGYNGTVTAPTGGSQIPIGSSFDVTWQFPPDFVPMYSDNKSNPEKVPYYSWRVMFRLPDDSKTALMVGQYNFTGPDTYNTTPRKITVTNLQATPAQYNLSVEFSCGFDSEAQKKVCGGNLQACRPCAGFFEPATARLDGAIEVLPAGSTGTTGSSGSNPNGSNPGSGGSTNDGNRLINSASQNVGQVECVFLLMAVLAVSSFFL